jgi:hypothetical protein
VTFYEINYTLVIDKINLRKVSQELSSLLLLICYIMGLNCRDMTELNLLVSSSSGYTYYLLFDKQREVKLVCWAGCFLPIFLKYRDFDRLYTSKGKIR